MVEVFKTNVQEVARANQIVEQLLERFPSYRVNFDLEDCDKILRIEGESIDTVLICNLLEQANAECCVL